ncbi:MULTISPECIES: SdpI family protein [Burkholderia]|uniref:SdpI family protein n=1 Tax=Burkholderia TaxID=32008 RepID=UPI00084219C3|nr:MULTISPECIES: SdpI family protein [unclassified Burkholderia]AOK29642.1 hypothetical protein AQ611_09600 [Burkholderia sp. Bp7605]
MPDLPPTMLFLLAGASFFLIAVPLAAQWIKPNRFYGVRLSATLRDEAVWYRCNRIFGVALMITSAVYVAALEYCTLRGIPVPRLTLLTTLAVAVAIPTGLCLIALKPPGGRQRGARR